MKTQCGNKVGTKGTCLEDRIIVKDTVRESKKEPELHFIKLERLNRTGTVSHSAFRELSPHSSYYSND